jgi:hypothetical protein
MDLRGIDKGYYDKNNLPYPTSAAIYCEGREWCVVPEPNTPDQDFYFDDLVRAVTFIEDQELELTGIYPGDAPADWVEDYDADFIEWAKGKIRKGRD